MNMKLYSTGHALRSMRGSAPQPEPQDLSKTDHQLSHSLDFHDVLCRRAWLKIGRRVESVNSSIDKTRFSTSIKTGKKLAAFAHETLHKFLSRKLRGERGS